MGATKAVIYLNNLRDNIRAIRKIVGSKTKICMAVKADAYGHGAIQISRAALQEGVDYLGVASVDEGSELRRAGIKAPLLLFSLPIPEDIPFIIGSRLTPFVADEGLLLKLEREAARARVIQPVHLKIDTGMGRIGCRSDEAIKLARLITDSPSLRLDGVCTHFPAADTGSQEFTMRQLDSFKQIIAELKAMGIDPGTVHSANSGAIIGCKEAYFDMVRPGIMLYGYYPSTEQSRNLILKPVMAFKTKVVFLKKLAKDCPISYGMTYTTERETLIATLPAGYADGYNRLLSNKGEVFINGRRYPVRGRVCMDQFMIEIGLDNTDEVKLYDEAILFGPYPGCPDAEELATLIDTIPYEVMCSVSKRVERVYVDQRINR